jgi:hypothetical protein
MYHFTICYSVQRIFIWFYNTESDGLDAGESRFITQLEAEPA